MDMATLKRKAKLLVEEHEANMNNTEARDSAADAIKAGASPAQLYTMILYMLTAKHKDEAAYAERSAALLTVRLPVSHTHGVCSPALSHPALPSHPQCAVNQSPAEAGRRRKDLFCGMWEV